MKQPVSLRLLVSAKKDITAQQDRQLQDLKRLSARLVTCAKRVQLMPISHRMPLTVRVAPTNTKAGNHLASAAQWATIVLPVQ